MPDRIEFTAPDGSKRWCSRDVLRLEHHIRNYPHATFANPNRSSRDRLLKPKPSGIWWRPGPSRRWHLYRHYNSCSVVMELLGQVWWYESGLTGYYVSETPIRVIHRGTLSDCAHALVNAIRGDQ